MRSENQPGGQHGSRGDAERSFIERARRAQIVEAAVEVIAARGFARASLARIAERAGISKGVISYHFAGKSELIEQLVRQVYERIGVFVAERLEGQSVSAAWIRLYVSSLATYMQGHRVQLAALGEIFGNYRTPEGELRYGVASSEEMYQGLEAAFREGQANGEFREFDTRVMAVTFQSSVDSMFAYWMTYPERDLTAYARELAGLFVHAMCLPGRQETTGT
ncbi:TetR/AcrR family transcriptional regulator [Streptomyces sp. HNM0574]|uniref:TetR/AcrR family transcriptional regulator n=1 Tax=Streptomyces sp. HNM0574 TaxID=2714954 RepID=UPI00146B4460|nr:TetR/AcrR family transcriptional regulator [Streptomyces sp. HNM0574]NLU68575.1 TetR family transcriptional regulator [Streptomyces sp. HNM0574]